MSILNPEALAFVGRETTPVTEVVTNFGEPLHPEGDRQPLGEARMIAGTVAGVRVISIYAPNGRVVGSPFFAAKLAWFDKLAAWLARCQKPADALLVGGDFNVAPTDLDVWDATACHGGTHVSPEERVPADHPLRPIRKWWMRH